MVASFGDERSRIEEINASGLENRGVFYCTSSQIYLLAAKKRMAAQRLQH